MISILSHPFGPIGLAVLLVSFGAVVFFWRGAGQSRWLQYSKKFIGGVAMLIGALGVIGAGFSAVKYQNALNEYPLRGKLVDIGDAKTHIWCEGESDKPTIVLTAGGYGQGLWLYPLHEALAKTHRVCSYDRPGIGRADPGRMPRTIDRVINETIQTLEGAGENGPYVFAGHSFGGLYSANIADIYPEKVAGIILLDPTPPGWFVVASGLFGCGDGRPNIMTMLGAAYGLGYIDALNPLMSPAFPVSAYFDKEIWKELVAWEVRPSSIASGSSALHAPCAAPFSIVRTDGALGDVPLLNIIQTVDPSVEAWVPDQISDRERENWDRWQEHQTAQYHKMSTNGELRFAPLGGTHQFPLTEVEFTRKQIQEFIDGLPAQIVVEADCAEVGSELSTC